MSLPCKYMSLLRKSKSLLHTKKHGLLLSATAIILMLGYQQNAKASENVEPEAVSGEYVVVLKPHLQKSYQAMSQEDMSKVLSASVKTYLPRLNVVVIKRASFEKSASVLQSMLSHPDVAYIEPNYIYHINKTPLDTLYSQQWGLANIGQKDSAGQTGIAGVDINAQKAWDVQTGSKKTIVAVIDTGINYNHPDLKNNMWVNTAEAQGKVGVDDDKNGVIDDIYGYNTITGSGKPLDDQMHGSHCAGVIGAQSNNRLGISGVNWNVSLMAVKFLDSRGSGSLDNAIKGIDYAVKMKAKILSNSWGGGPFSQALLAAINRANSAGALFVVAAGNESNNNDSRPSYPANYKVANVLAVAAIDNRGRKASFSNYGKTSVHIAAPGVNILSTVLKSNYANLSGTSMATPHVAGVAALVSSQFPDMNAVQLKQRLLSTARPLSGLKNLVVTGSVIDAGKAVTAAR